MRPSLEMLLCKTSEEDISSSINLEQLHSVDVRPSSSKRKHDGSDYVTELGRPKPKRSRGTRGRLYMLLDMPLDVVLEIFSHLDPLDLLRLARTCKNPLRDFLMNQSLSISIWKATRSNVGLPPPPDDMSEPSFADLVFVGYCHICGCSMRQNENILWVVPTRLCGGCRMKTFKPTWSLFSPSFGVTKEDLRLPECVPSDKDNFYMEVLFKSHLEEYNEVVHDKEKLEAWFTRKIACMNARKESAKLYEAWVKTREQERISDRDNARQRRQKAILRKLNELGWQEEIDKMTPRSDFYSSPLVREPRELTDRVWKRIKNPMITLMEQTKTVRMHQVVYRSRYEILRRMYPAYCIRQDSGLLLPNLGDIITLESVKQVAESDSTSSSSSNSDGIFDFLSHDLPNISQSWYHSKCLELVSIARREASEFQLSNLFLATTVFKCTASKCDHAGRRLTLPSVFTHACTSSYCFRRSTLRELREDQRWFGSVPWNQGGDRVLLDLEGSKRVATLIEKVNLRLKESGPEGVCLDPANATVDHLNELCVIVECLTCSSSYWNDRFGQRKMMFWMHALNHDDEHRHDIWDYHVYTRFDLPENTAFFEAEHKAVMIHGGSGKYYPAKKIFACSHCNHDLASSDCQQSSNLQQRRFSRKELIDHVRQWHDKSPIERGDWEWTANVSLADIPSYVLCGQK